MQKIVPNIWCNTNAEEAGGFYASAFSNARFEVESRYPEKGLLDFQQPFAGQPLTVSVTIGGYRIVLINAGDEFHPNPSISFMLNFDPILFDASEERARTSLDHLWANLTEGGVVLMPLQEYPFSKHYGWVQDRYGVSWQLMLTDPAGDERPFIVPSLLFGNSAQNRAQEAVEHYLEVFQAAGIEANMGTRFLYPEDTGPAKAGTVMYSDFALADQWFVAMDAGSEQAESFSCGVSLEVSCRDQAQIDKLWNALSAVPEAEQCGWLADRFGVSWQIVPENMGELMQHPGAFERMLQMKKLVIAEL